MKASFPRPPRRPLSRASARNSALLNQCATPGLGSLLAGRYVAGTGQLLLAIAGFVMVVGWFILVLIQMYHQITGGAEPKSAAWLGWAGAATFVAAWLWALVTSLQLLSAAKKNEARNVPPRLG